MERIAAATRMAMADPRLQESYRSQGLEPDVDLGPDKFQRLVEDELARLAPLVKSIALKRDRDRAWDLRVRIRRVARAMSSISSVEFSSGELSAAQI